VKKEEIEGFLSIDPNKTNYTRRRRGETVIGVDRVYVLE
jgi:hypothetical protein